MQVSPNASSQLSVRLGPLSAGTLPSNGAARLAGTLALAYQPGIYHARSYTLVSAENGVTGSFSNVTGTVPTPGLTQTVTLGPNDVQLQLSGVAQPTNDTVLPAMTTSVLLNGQRLTGILLDRLGSRYAGIADGPIPFGEASLAPIRTTQAGNIGTLVGIGTALPQALASQGAWFRGIGGFASVNGNASAPGFNGNTGGFLAGFDRPVAPNLSLGIAAGYLHSDVSESAISSGRVESGRVAAYGGGWWGPNLLTGTAGYAYDRISTTRSFTGIGTAAERHDGHEFSIAGQWSLPTPVPGISGPATVTPKIGVQYLHLYETGFKERGADGFNLSAGANDTDSVQPYIGLAAAEKFVTADGTEITPELRLGYSREVASNSRLLSVASVDGTPFVARGVKPSRDIVTAGTGITVRAQDNLFLYANYDAVLHTGNTSDQTVSAGLRVRF
jgi:outer membrane autotransporter protein